MIPPSLAKEKKKNVRLQLGALCYRVVGGKPQILLVTSRKRGRWIIPKGWPMDGKSPARAALIEAWEEGGIKGNAHEEPIGRFGYIKQGDGAGVDVPCVVDVYPIKVKSRLKDFPEKGQRRRKWYSLKRAAQKVGEPELRKIIKSFDPFKLH